MTGVTDTVSLSSPGAPFATTIASISRAQETPSAMAGMPA